MHVEVNPTAGTYQTALTLRNLNSADNSSVGLDFINTSNANVGARIQALRLNTPYNHDTALVFSTRNNAGGSWETLNEKMRISPAGNVGIGTTSPGAALTVTKNSNGWDNGLRLLDQNGANEWNLHSDTVNGKFMI